MSDHMNSYCFICHDPASIATPGENGGDFFNVTCPKCGKYRITGTMAASDFTNVPSHLLSAVTRRRYESGEGQIELHNGNYESLISAIDHPLDPFRTLDLLLEFMLSKTGKADTIVRFNSNSDYPLLYCQDRNEFLWYMKKAVDLKLIEPGQGGYILALEGWKRLSELAKVKTDSKQAFVAMWFDQSLNEAWNNGFKSALEETGFNAIRVDLQEHNEKICDRIVAEIRRSGLVVADFTGQRGGVYFEAGFAMGLGLPVIWTCKATDIDNLHFDTRQYNHITWQDPADLKTKLKNRIAATIPKTVAAT